MNKKDSIKFNKTKLRKYFTKKFSFLSARKEKDGSIGYYLQYIKWLEQQVVTMVNCGLLVLVEEKEEGK